MLNPIWLLVIMLGVFLACDLVVRMPRGLALAAAAMAGALAGGAGLPLRHLVEGGFAYIDPILIIATAMVFMGGLEESGALTSISRGLLIGLHRRPVLLIIGMTVFIMFPGMITGQSTSTVLTTGAIAAPVLAACGIPRPRVGAMIAMSAVYGMIAPPVSLPTMIIGSGVDMPFTGFDLPLAVATFPLAVGVNLALAGRCLRRIDLEAVMPQLGEDHASRYGLRLFLPLVLVAALLILLRVAPAVAGDLRLPMIFLIGALLCGVTGRRYNMLRSVQRSIRQGLPVMGILIGVGMFVQIMTLVGIRGQLVVATLNLPPAWKLLGVSVSIPLFGAVSAYGTASVLGVPFLLSFLGQNEIVVGSALSLLSGLGDLVPPTALIGMFTAQVIGEPNYYRILKYTALPTVITALWAVLMILLANPLARILSL